MNADLAERLGRYLDASAPVLTVDEILERAEAADAADGGVPGTPFPPDEHDLAESRRRWPLRAAAIVLLVAVGAALVVLARDGNESDEPDRAHQVETVDDDEAPPTDPTLLDHLLHDYEWRELPVPPIEPRDKPISLWTGDEWFVWGGSAAIGDGPLSDGAVFDPNANEWRSIPDAPVAWRDSARAAVGEGEVVVMSRDEGSAAIERFDLDTETWELVDNPDLEAQLQPLASFDLHPHEGGYVVVGVPLQTVRDLPPGETAPPAGSPVVVLRLDGALEIVDELPGELDAVPNAVLASGVVGSDLVVWRVQLENRGNDVSGGPYTAGAVLDLDSGDWRAIPETVEFHFAGGNLSVAGGQLVAWGVEQPAACAMSGSCPPSPEPAPSLGWTFDPNDDRVTAMNPGPADFGGDSAVSTGDYVIARSEKYTGGLGDGDNPPPYTPREWGLYDPATNQWYRLSDGDRGIPGERGDIAHMVVSQADMGAGAGQAGVIADVWTGDQLLTWSTAQTGGNRRNHMAAAYGPAPDRSVLDRCEPGPDGPLPVEFWAAGEGPYPFPTEGDGQAEPLPWTRVDATALGAERGYALLFSSPSLTPRPGRGIEVVDENCKLLGYWVLSGYGTVRQVTPDEFAELDFRWYASAGAIDDPTEGQVVAELAPGYAGGTPAQPSVVVVADPAWSEFERGPAAGAADHYPRWHPIDPDPGAPTRVHGGTITGTDDASHGQWASYASLEPGTILEVSTGLEQPRMIKFEVTQVREFDTDRVEPRGNEDGVGLRLVIEHDDGTSTVVDARAWTDADVEAAQQQAVVADLDDLRQGLEDGTIDPYEERARLQREYADMMETRRNNNFNPLGAEWQARVTEEVNARLAVIDEFLADQ